MNVQKLIKEAFQQIVSEEYNGYKNYPTFLIVSQITGDEESFNHWSNKAEEVIKANLANLPTDNAGINRDKAINDLGGLMKEYHESRMPELDSTNADLLQYTLNSVDWYKVASKFITDETVQDAISNLTSPMSLNEGSDLGSISTVPDAEYLMVSVKGAGKDEEYGIMVMPRTLKMYFQDPIKLVNAIINERGSYKFVKYIKDHKDPNITPSPSFMQIFRSFKLETHELNPQHDPMANPEAAAAAPTDAPAQ